MGCTSSSPAAAVGGAAPAARTAKLPPAAAAPDAGANQIRKDGTKSERKREKKITAGTEAMFATAHDEDDDADASNTSNSRIVDPGSATTTTEDAASACGRAVLAAGHLAVRYAGSSRRGRDPDDRAKPNQDRYGVVVVRHRDNDSTAAAAEDESEAAAGGLFVAVFDGHGPDGALCSEFVQRRLPDLVRKHLLAEAAPQRRNEEEPNGGDSGLSTDQVRASLLRAHVECNDEMRSSQDINDMFSGTTSISMYVHSTAAATATAAEKKNDTTTTAESGPASECRITVSNVGDSRAVLGTTTSGGGAGASSSSSSLLQAVPLSNDQTPYRPDEAARCVQSGARILSFGQIEGNGNGNDDGSDDDSVEDPPRVWAKRGRFPGTAFTRSIGDAVAEKLGVCAEPEMLTVQVSRSERVIVLASDGIFDVLSNQEVVDLCFRHYRDDPARACEAVIAKSHEEWLLNDECVDEASASYDDMTVVCIFIDDIRGGDDDESKGVVGESASAVAAGEIAAEQLPPPSTTAPQPHHKRVRQKTLRNLEEMEGEHE